MLQGYEDDYDGGGGGDIDGNGYSNGCDDSSDDVSTHTNAHNDTKVTNLFNQHRRCILQLLSSFTSARSVTVPCSYLTVKTPSKLVACTVV
jgi:hypothetical protein